MEVGAKRYGTGYLTMRWIAIIYLCERVRGDPQPDHRETGAAQNLAATCLEKLEEPIEPLSLWLMTRALRSEYTSISADLSSPFGPSPSFL